MPDDPTGDSLMDAAIEEAVQSAVNRYEGAVPPAALEEIRRLVRLGLRSDPMAQRMLREIAATQARRPQEMGQQGSDKNDLRGFPVGAPEDGARRPEDEPVPSKPRGTQR